MKRLLFTPLAESDLNDILSYIAQHRPLTARSVIAKIRMKCERIARHPGIGKARPEFPGDFRSSPVQRWEICYRVTDEAVEVHRILDGARHIDSLLG